MRRGKDCWRREGGQYYIGDLLWIGALNCLLERQSPLLYPKLLPSERPAEGSRRHRQFGLMELRMELQLGPPPDSSEPKRPI